MKYGMVRVYLANDPLLNICQISKQIKEKNQSLRRVTLMLFIILYMKKTLFKYITDSFENIDGIISRLVTS